MDASYIKETNYVQKGVKGKTLETTGFYPLLH